MDRMEPLILGLPKSSTVLPEVQKDLEDVSAGTFFLNMVHNNFAGNFTSKLARSTLTSPGTIRVKLGFQDLKQCTLAQLSQ
jgi:hypothetical protein